MHLGVFSSGGAIFSSFLIIQQVLGGKSSRGCHLFPFPGLSNDHGCSALEKCKIKKQPQRKAIADDAKQIRLDSQF